MISRSPTHDRLQTQLFDSLADAVICVKHDGTIVEFNREAERLLGYERGEVSGGSILQLMPDLEQEADPDPEASDRNPTNPQVWYRRLATSDGAQKFAQRQPLVAEARSKSGELIPISIGYSFVAGESESLVVGTLKDLRAERLQRRVSNYLETTFEAMDEGVSIYDEQYRLVAWNQRYVEMNHGIDPHHITYGAELFDLYRDAATRGLFGPGDPEELARVRIDAIRTGRMIVTELLYPENGAILRINRFPLPGGGICATFRDITEEQRLASELSHSRKMEAVGRLAGGISHDLNNLLMVILGNSEMLLREKDLPTNLRPRLQSIFEAAERGSHVTHRMLTLSRKQPLLPEPVRFAELLHALSSLLRRTIGENIDVELASDEGLWECSIDRSQLESMIINLATNARDAIAGESGKIRLEASNVVLDGARALGFGVVEGEYVQLVVSDTGPGMPEHVLDQVFEPYFTTKSPGEGTGLGLSMAHGFVTQSGGGISIESGSEGTRVWVVFPRWTDDGTSSTAITRSLDEERAAVEGVVLLVEDESEVRNTVEAQLKHMGFAVITAEDGESAKFVLEAASRIDLVMTDLILPGSMGGQQIAELALTIHPEIPIIFMSGYYEEALDRLRKPGRETLLVKPFTMEELEKTILAVLRGVDA